MMAFPAVCNLETEGSQRAAKITSAFRKILAVLRNETLGEKAREIRIKRSSEFVCATSSSSGLREPLTLQWTGPSVTI